MPRRLNLADDWYFATEEVHERNGDSHPLSGVVGRSLYARQSVGATPVQLPHNPRVEDFVAHTPWQGICWYHKTLTVPPEWIGKKFVLEFEGAMTVADVWINGVHSGRHEGGYLPFAIDATTLLSAGENELAVRLDNHDHAHIPPGKPLRELDFCWYGGLYRGVFLRVLDPLHITDPVHEAPADGGIFVTYPEANQQRAVVSVRTCLANDHPRERRCRLQLELLDADNTPVATLPGEEIALAEGERFTVSQRLKVTVPRLWSPRRPHLYTLRATLLAGEEPVDTVSLQIGIRRIGFSAAGGFQVNGQRMFLRGANRHQEYPYVGYALTEAMSWRDARKLKEAGFDYVRCSHYPPSPAFLRACDALGLVVMNTIPGWQYLGGDDFRDFCERNVREMIRRDRNHPCVVLWETSLNETDMPAEFAARLHRAAHEELPGDQCYTCGWQEQFDVFLQARQHGNCRAFRHPAKACVISEYGDWEYYAQNTGLHQTDHANLLPVERTSRQRRGDGEKRLLQQALNFQHAANDNRSTPAAGDGVWSAFDYSRGYARDHAACGVMDSLRLPKFSYWFFRSQRSPEETCPGADLGPMVHAATWWTPASSPKVRVFSNCEEVELIVNGRSLGRRGAGADDFSRELPHPPFCFDAGRFEAGELRAVGWIGGKVAAVHTVRTPGSPAGLRLRADFSGQGLWADGADAVFVYAEVVDDLGTLVPIDALAVSFEVIGVGGLVGRPPFSTEGGITGALVQSMTTAGTIEVRASAELLGKASLVFASIPYGEPDWLPPDAR